MDELLDVVDEQDDVIGTTTKQGKQREGHITRTAVVFLVDGTRLLVGRRAPTKRSFPDMYDVSACGNVSAGESYEHAARRELREELGIDCALERVGHLLNGFEDRGERLRFHTEVFVARYDAARHGPIRANDETIELVWMGLRELERLVREHPERCTPGLAAELPLITGAIK